MPSASFDNTMKTMLEDLFEMSGGYVLDFTNGTFASFVETCAGFDPYTRYDGSKANILRSIWAKERMDVVAKINLDLIERWKLSQLKAGLESTSYQQKVVDEATAHFGSAGGNVMSAEDLSFLEKDTRRVDLSALPRELTSGQVVAARLDEIDKALEAEAPLAVIFLVGSTLEGLLSELSLSQAAAFTASKVAPNTRNVIKPLDTWTLSELIGVSRDLGILSEDVARHANQVRNFRNYIHPRQQLKEGFEPRNETARIAQQVLRGALADLERLAHAATT